MGKMEGEERSLEFDEPEIFVKVYRREQSWRPNREYFLFTRIGTAALGERARADIPFLSQVELANGFDPFS